jgi:ABC-2 type transport system ATP-binding protein
MSQIVELHQLSRVFDGVTAVNDLSLKVEKGELFGLVGPDGAGKTTTIRLLCGILEPSGGDARVAGYSIRTEPEAIKSRIGYMPQRFGLYGDLTVWENLHFYADVYQVSRKERSERLRRLLDFSQLEPFSDRLARDLSGGMKQKLGLACALIHTPEVLFLDEPTCGVDPLSRRDFWRILYDLTRQGVTIFMSTAYLDEAERCTRVGLMHQGRLMVCATPGSIRSRLPGEVWQIGCDNNRLAEKRIRSIQGVTAHLVGNTIHLIFTEPGMSMDRVVNDLDEAGLGILERKRLVPSLEDAFLHLIQKEVEKTAS